jgi:hypothetical protein
VRTSLTDELEYVSSRRLHEQIVAVWAEFQHGLLYFTDSILNYFKYKRATVLALFSPNGCCKIEKPIYIIRPSIVIRNVRAKPEQ